jgi:hypothetical protein
MRHDHHVRGGFRRQPGLRVGHGDEHLDDHMHGLAAEVGERWGLDRRVAAADPASGTGTGQLSLVQDRKLLRRTGDQHPGLHSAAVIPVAQTANLGPPLCSAYLSSNSTAKTATSTVNMVLHGQQATCSGWLELSADNGTTWRQVTPTYSVLPNNEWAFAPAVADGTGLLARACVQSATQSACTTAW